MLRSTHVHLISISININCKHNTNPPPELLSIVLPSLPQAEYYCDQQLFTHSLRLRAGTIWPAASANEIVSARGRPAIGTNSHQPLRRGVCVCVYAHVRPGRKFIVVVPAYRWFHQYHSRTLSIQLCAPRFSVNNIWYASWRAREFALIDSDNSKHTHTHQYTVMEMIRSTESSVRTYETNSMTY